MEGAIMLAPEIIDNGAMTSLNLASTELRAKGAKIVAEAIKAPTRKVCKIDSDVNCVKWRLNG